MRPCWPFTFAILVRTRNGVGLTCHVLVLHLPDRSPQLQNEHAAVRKELHSGGEIEVRRSEFRSGRLRLTRRRCRGRGVRVARSGCRRHRWPARDSCSWCSPVRPLSATSSRSGSRPGQSCCSPRPGSARPGSRSRRQLSVDAVQLRLIALLAVRRRRQARRRRRRRACPARRVVALRSVRIAAQVPAASVARTR